MLPKPRTQKASRTKRLSAPAKSLQKDTLIAVSSLQPLKVSTSSKTSTDTNDLMDFLNFGDSNDTLEPASNPFLQTNKSAPSHLSSINENITNDNPFDGFDFFDANTAGIASSKLKIHPKLLNSRESKSLVPDVFFDISMWDNFETPDFDPPPAGKEAPKTLKSKSVNLSSKKVKKSRKKKKRDSKIENVSENAPENVAENVSENAGNEGEEKENTNKNVKKLPKAKSADAEIPETNCLQELQRGAALLKYPRRTGFPHFKHIQLSTDNQRIQWFSKRKPLNQTCIWIKDIREVVQGQETEVFRKFHQKTLEKSSFSIVYGNKYSTLDVAAKSIDECEMWVRTIRRLMQIQRSVDGDLKKLKVIHCGIHFKDRNRPMSRVGSGAFVRANNSKTLKIDPIALKEIEKDMEQLHKTFSKVVQLTQKNVILDSNEYPNVQYVLSELEERIEELTYEVANIRDTELAKREVWRANVDLTAIQEKVEVLLKYSDRRRSNFL